MVEDKPDIGEFVDFLLETSHILIACGCSSNRVEKLLVRLGSSWGFKVEAMAEPTSVWLVARREVERLSEGTRVSMWSINLDRLAKINTLVDQGKAPRSG